MQRKPTSETDKSGKPESYVVYALDSLKKVHNAMKNKDASPNEKLLNIQDPFAGSVRYPSDSPRLVTNRLSFRTNSTTILPYLKSKAGKNSGHPMFSLNAIVDRPAALVAPQNNSIYQLSLQNIQIPILDETVRKQFLAGWIPEYQGKLPPAKISQAIHEAQHKLKQEQASQPERDLLNQAVTSYENSGYFSQFDWCMEHWGTPDDIQEVNEATFLLPTACIEFQTLSTPPIIALQQLANTFPSVLFTLLYRYAQEDSWTEVQFYPFPPFGY